MSKSTIVSESAEEVEFPGSLEKTFMLLRKLEEESKLWDERIRPKNVVDLIITSPAEYSQIKQYREYLHAALTSAAAKAFEESGKGFRRASKLQKIKLFSAKKKK